MNDIKSSRFQTKREKKVELRSSFIGRARQYLILNPNARQQLSKAFGLSVTASDAVELSHLFTVMTEEIYNGEQIRTVSDTKLEAYFFVFTMMAHYAKSSEINGKEHIETKLKRLYWNSSSSNTTKEKIRTLMGKQLGDSGLFQKQLASLTKLIGKEYMADVDYISLLQDLCEWNCYDNCGTVSKICYRWSKEIFLYKEEEE